jgi:hypothetical protein
VWLGCCCYCVEYLYESGAAAEVSGEAFADLFGGGVRIVGEEVGCGHKHSGSADAALGAAAFEEGSLQRV